MLKRNSSGGNIGAVVTLLKEMSVPPLSRPKFAKTKLVDTATVSAGTLNPHLPKRTISPRLIPEWLEEPGD